MRDTRCKSGFTLVELLMALMVTSIVLTAVATLAYALGTVSDATDDTHQKQAQVRYATVRISELIRHCKLIYVIPGYGLAVWRADDNNDGKININELVYIDGGWGKNHLWLYEFSSSNNLAMGISDIEELVMGGWSGCSYEMRCMQLIPECSNVQFQPEDIVPQSKFVSISFDLSENGAVHQYQIEAGLRCWAGNLLDSAGNIVVDDD